ncbi:MAG: hypothetical protein G01um101430_99 [Parcubacteria group bacterium Gr01-1014_30]|nr:MAG: hypothetical protein G01um101430_99 [Parcubacteria group bacterium Gr01-1014_30]
MQQARPQIFRTQKDQAKILALKRRSSTNIVDALEQQLRELFLARHPKLKLSPEKAKQETAKFLKSKKKKPLEKQGSWVYFKWNRTLVHILDEDDFFELRTARNKNLITKGEQEKLRTFRIGIAGLSVGNSAALVLALEGAETMRLADFDELSLSNLNRIRGSITQLGLNKTIMTARQVYELNPYAKLELFEKGLHQARDLKKFVADPPKLDVLVDEIDDVIMKVQLRLKARKLRIPVLSVADNGTNSIADVERFDLEPKRKLYHGLLQDSKASKLQRDILSKEKMRMIADIVGVEYVTSRMKTSFLEVGNTLYSWPQLGGASMLSGATLAYLVKKIAFGENLESGKYDVNFDRIFENQYDSLTAKQRRNRENKEFLHKQKELFS